MKSIYSVVIAALALIVASCGTKTTTDEAPASDITAGAISVDSLLSNADRLVDSLITVEGVCTHTCKHGARKIFLAGTEDNHSIRIEACDLGAFDPEVVNSHVYVTGHVREQRIDEEYLKNWEELLAESVTAEGSDNVEVGCETEREARGVESSRAKDQIAEYRDKIAKKVEDGGNPWLSFYYVDATAYEVKD